MGLPTLPKGKMPFLLLKIPPPCLKKIMIPPPAYLILSIYYPNLLTKVRQHVFRADMPIARKFMADDEIRDRMSFWKDQLMFGIRR